MKRVLLPLFLLAACAPAGGPSQAVGSLMNRGQCDAADWAAIGFADGQAGRAQPARIEALEATCGVHAIRPDREAYFAAYERGAAGG